MRALDVLLWPFRLIWLLIKLVVPPAAIAAGVWGLFLLIHAPHWWFALVIVVAVLYEALVFALMADRIKGQWRSMGRGSYTVRTRRGGGSW
jgi:hypothetical protein